MLNLAHISPNKDAYSETFIQNHKKYFEANVYYYYGGYLPRYLESKDLLRLSRTERVIRNIKKYIFKKDLPESMEIKALMRSFEKHKIDVVYAEYGPTGVCVLEACRKMNLPLIVNFHGFDASEKETLKIHEESYKEMFSYAARIISVSKFMSQRLLEMGCPAEKLEYITYGPDDIFFHVRPTYEEKSFMAVGRFVDKKAPYYTICAFKKVVEKHPDAKLYMAGKGVLLNSCMNLVRFFKLEKNVIFLGVLDKEQIVSYYAKIRGFVQHSVTAMTGDMEGTPVAILEASASALPVISTYHAGIPDVIINRKTGLLVNEHDVEGMANNMIYLLDNPEEAKTLGQAGRQNIKENYRMDIHMKKINSVINNLN